MSWRTSVDSRGLWFNPVDGPPIKSLRGGHCPPNEHYKISLPGECRLPLSFYLFPGPVSKRSQLDDQPTKTHPPGPITEQQTAGTSKRSNFVEAWVQSGQEMISNMQQF